MRIVNIKCWFVYYKFLSFGVVRILVTILASWIGGLEYIFLMMIFIWDMFLFVFFLDLYIMVKVFVFLFEIKRIIKLILRFFFFYNCIINFLSFFCNLNVYKMY